MELLSGHPLALVPESIKNIEKAFSALKDRYGDEEQVLGLSVIELKKLGPQPEKYKDQVVFFINLESKILDLGAKGQYLGRLAYGQEVFNAIFNLVTVGQISCLLWMEDPPPLEPERSPLTPFCNDNNADVLGPMVICQLSL